MTVTVKREVTNKRLVVITATAGKNESTPAIEVGDLDDVHVHVYRSAGSTQTGTVQGSNEGSAQWVQSHSSIWVTTTGDGGNEELTGLDGSQHQSTSRLEAVMRYIRLVVTNTAGGASDELTMIVTGKLRD